MAFDDHWNNQEKVEADRQQCEKGAFKKETDK